jgi:hypothetical protein
MFVFGCRLKADMMVNSASRYYPKITEYLVFKLDVGLCYYSL